MNGKYFLTDLVLTTLLLFFTIFLVKDALNGYWLYLILFLICGFCFSWFFKDRQHRLIRTFINIAAFTSLAWIAHPLLNPALIYKDIILVCVRVALILEAILSFNVCWPKYLNYMQALSMSLFMCSPLVLKGYNEALIMAVLGYFICWLAILKVKFYKFLKSPVNERYPKANYSLILLVVISIISSFVAATLYFKFPFTKAIKGGIFPKEIDIESGRNTLEKEYYALEEQLQKKITELIPKLRIIDDQHSVLRLLSYLIKETSTIMETEQAKNGLISHLKAPGAGLEKGEGEDMVILLKDFIDKKAALKLKKIQEQAMRALKKSPFNIKARITISTLMRRIQDSDSLQQVLEYERQLHEAIDKSSLDTIAKKELTELARQLKEWKVFQLRHRNAGYADKVSEEAESEQAPETHAPVQIEKEYPQPIEKSLQVRKFPFLKGALLLILCIIPGLLFTLYFLVEQQKNKLISLLQNPREFIINLYENLKEVLTIFGARYSEAVAPLFYALKIEQKYSIENKLFSKLTTEFEEAKYSKHILRPEDGYTALNDYNGFLRTVFNNQDKFSLFLKCCLALVHRIPLFIYK